MSGEFPHVISPNEYRRQGEKLGIARDVLDSATARMATNQRLGSRAILSLGHLSHLTGAPYPYLRELIERRRDPYSEHSRRKRGSGVRPISIPEPVLMDVQRFILDSALSNISFSASSFAYQKGKSVVDCASRHLGARWLVKLDLHNFFSSVREQDVYSAFQARGYSRLVSFELARLCTRASLQSNLAPDRYPCITSYRSTSVGVLPQGAPTSGALANIAATPIDGALTALAENNGAVFTRYSDDLTFSVGGEFCRERASTLISHARRIITDHHFVLHEKKTRVIPPGARHIVLGLNVDGPSVKLLPEFRRRIESHLRGVETFGLHRHAEHRGFRSVLSMINVIDGCISYALDVEREWAQRRRLEWTAILQEADYLPSI